LASRPDLGFTGNGTLAGSDQIDLTDINYTVRCVLESFDPVHDTLSVSDGQNSPCFTFVGSYVAQNFSFTSDAGTARSFTNPPVKFRRIRSRWRTICRPSKLPMRHR